MKLTVPAPHEGSPTAAGDEIAWRRELKQLRIRVAQLEAERGTQQRPSVDVKRSDRHGPACGIPCGVVVIDNQPRVECAVCGCRLDAVEVLRDYANHERNFCYSLEHLRKERQNLSLEIRKLQTMRLRLRRELRKTLRLRLRRELRKTLPPPPVPDAPGMSPGRRRWVQNARADRMLDQVLAREPDDGAT